MAVPAGREGAPARSGLCLLAFYQLYRFSHTYSSWLPVLAALDLVIAWVVWREGRSGAADGMPSVPQAGAAG